MNALKKIDYIKKWIINYCKSIKKQPESLVVGVSGGVDSAVTSTICAMTNIVTYAVSIPINQNLDQHNLSIAHLKWLNEKFDNIKTQIIPLDDIFVKFNKTLKNFQSERGFANSRSRFRMLTLYQIAQSKNGVQLRTSVY